MGFEAVKKSTIALWVVLAAGVVVVSAGALALSGAHPLAIWNVSGSMPEGLYLRTSAGTLRDGDVVAVCLSDVAHRHIEVMALARHYVGPDRLGACSYRGQRFAPLVKRIVAVPGQDVVIGRRGIFVNGHLQAQSVPLKADSAGRALPQISFSGRLAAGTYVVMGENPLSYDSRYFGPIPRSDVLERLWKP